MIEKEDLGDALDVIFNPEKYGYIECWDCCGKGARESEEEDINQYDMCDTCGGDGVMKTPKIFVKGDDVRISSFNTGPI